MSARGARERAANVVRRRWLRDRIRRACDEDERCDEHARFLRERVVLGVFGERQELASESELDRDLAELAVLRNELSKDVRARGARSGLLEIGDRIFATFESP